MSVWFKKRIKMYIYSSGSVEAQKLLFGNSEAGDLLKVLLCIVYSLPPSSSLSPSLPPSLSFLSLLLFISQYISGHFDTKTGNKRETSSYTKIANEIGLLPSQVLFLTDIVQGNFTSIIIMNLSKQSRKDLHKDVMSLYIPPPNAV